jgi:uncharacterized protein (TIRG00374 family)
MKRLLRPQVLLWIVLPFLLWWAWRGIAWSEVADLLKGLLGWRILAWVGVNVILVLLFNLRWWLILSFLGHKVPFLHLAGYRLAGFAVSFLTPGPQFGGEPLQVQALRRKERIPAALALASVVLDKSIELMSNFMFLASGLLVLLTGGLLRQSSQAAPHLVLASLLGAGLLALLPLGYLGLLWVGKRPLAALLQRLVRGRFPARRLKDWAGIARLAEDQAADFCRFQPLGFGLILLQSLLVWCFLVFDYWLSFILLGLSLPLTQVIFILVAARLALLLPVPGGIGMLEASQVLAAQALGFDPDFAVSVNLLARCRDFLLAGWGALLAAKLLGKSTGQPLPVRVEDQFLVKQEVEHETGS